MDITAPHQKLIALIRRKPCVFKKDDIVQCIDTALLPGGGSGSVPSLALGQLYTVTGPTEDNLDRPMVFLRGYVSPFYSSRFRMVPDSEKPGAWGMWDG